jgi:hypothetical protein
MMPTERTNETTRDEWRELGFFYDQDETVKVWRFIGSKQGLRQFVKLLRQYVGDPKRASLYEHDHYGPYMYLKVMTWHDSAIDKNSIHGTIADLTRLAQIVDEKLAAARQGDVVMIRDEYSQESTYSLRLDVKGAGFDPASVDPELNKAS